MTISLFSWHFHSGFGHEGIKRRSMFSTSDGTWKDVTYFAMLDTEWSMRAYIEPAPKSLWEELFARHERERQELLEWESSKDAKLARSPSLETIRRDGVHKKTATARSGTVKVVSLTQRDDESNEMENAMHGCVSDEHPWRSPKADSDWEFLSEASDSFSGSEWVSFENPSDSE